MHPLVPGPALPPPRPFTGRHISVILVMFFAVVVGVNVLMARLAMSSFGGVVVENSYVASQDFNRWLDAAADQRTLGWQAQARRASGGTRVALTVTGVPPGAIVTALARHPLGKLPDRVLHFTAAPDGRLLSAEPLPAGRWRLRIEITSGVHQWRAEQDLG